MHILSLMFQTEPKKQQPRPFQPYRAGTFQQGFFDSNPFKTDTDLPEEETERRDKELLKPFMPNNPAKKVNCTLS